VVDGDGEVGENGHVSWGESVKRLKGIHVV